VRAFTADRDTRIRLIRDATDYLRTDPRYLGLGLLARRADAVTAVNAALTTLAEREGK
jgi:hypothetical protein